MNGFESKDRADIGKTKIVELAPIMYRLAGVRVSALFFVCIPIGLMLGVFEVFAAFLLYQVLARFNLVASSKPTLWVAATWNPLITLIVVVFFVTILRYLAQLLPGAANSTFENKLRKALVQSTLNNPGEGGGYSVAEASYLLNAVISKSGVFLQAIVTVFGTLSTLMFIGFSLIKISPELSIFAVTVAIVFGLPVVSLKRFCARFSDRAYEYNRTFNSRFLKDVRNAHFLKLCGLNKYESAELGHLADKHKHNGVTYQSLFAISSHLPFFGATVLVVALLLLNESLNILPAVQLVPFVYLLNRTAGSVGALSAATGNIRELTPYAFELVQHAKSFSAPIVDTKGGRLASLNSLQVRNLVFGRGKPLASSMTFSAKSGEMLLISGPSGRGKTTLLLTLLGLVPKLSGDLVWGGVGSDAIDWMDYRKKIGFAGPEPFLIDADIRTNLLFGLHRREVSGAELNEALRVACAEFVHDLPGGLAHELREHGDGISAGQKQRLALARCLLRRPEVLVLDEATANIDEETEKMFFERLLEARPEIMIVAVSHRSSLRKFAQQIVEI
jgi:ABC-type multidrug transport system fused ATPase/permease subunit